MLKILKESFHRVAIMPKPPWISAIIRRLVMLLVPKRFQVGGIRYVFNPQDYIMAGTLFLGLYEKCERRIFSLLIGPGDLVIDIGANIGIFTAIAARQAGVSGSVIAFEPEPRNAGHLSEMLQLNGFNNVLLEEKALADRSSTFHLYLSKDNMGDHRLQPGEEARESIEITAVPLDEYLGGRVPKVLKMDIQGAEGLAVAGMATTLQNMPEGAMMMEFWPYALRRAGTDPQQILTAFAASGFAGYEIDTIKNVLCPLDEPKLLALKTEDEAANLLFLKGDDFRTTVLGRIQNCS
ncbi:MAG: FkbM family methyltransferase [Chthoniobacterales bacterium]